MFTTADYNIPDTPSASNFTDFMPRCTMCGVPLGYSNPRQLCAKTFCMNMSTPSESSTAKQLFALDSDDEREPLKEAPTTIRTTVPMPDTLPPAPHFNSPRATLSFAADFAGWTYEHKIPAVEVGGYRYETTATTRVIPIKGTTLSAEQK